jgi:hypothetical protein
MDDYVASVAASLDRPAVLKMEYLKLRAKIGSRLIIALEGKHDKPVYAQWVNRVRPGLTYEPFPCGNKKKVLQLRATLANDRVGSHKDIRFFVDRDFDDLPVKIDDCRVFMTCEYSIENYLVDCCVVDTILRDELHCDGAIELRSLLVETFRVLYEEFLVLTRPVNRLIFLARRLNIEIVGGIPDSLRDYVQIQLKALVPSSLAAEDFIKLRRVPTDEECELLDPEFDNFDKAKRYRGKFAFEFFSKWLSLVAEDRKAAASVYFQALEKNVKINTQVLGFGLLATRSRLPEGFSEHIALV